MTGAIVPVTRYRLAYRMRVVVGITTRPQRAEWQDSTMFTVTAETLITTEGSYLIDLDGGMTPPPYTTGYYVSMSDFGMVLGAAAAESNYMVAAVAQWVRATCGSVYVIGSWRDPLGGLHLDVNEHFGDLAAARAFGRANRQLAIWDIANNREITL